MSANYKAALEQLNVNESYLNSVFGKQTVQRGTNYFYNHQASIVDVQTSDKEGKHTIAIKAEVTGSYNNAYVTDILIVYFNQHISIKSSCTCPVGFYCKHSVAALLEFATSLYNENRQDIEAGTSLPHTQTSSAVDLWLDELSQREKRLVEQESVHTFNKNKTFLCYVITNDKHSPSSPFVIETYRIRYLKDGRIGKPVKQSLQELAGEYYYGSCYFNEQDLEITRLLDFEDRNDRYFFYRPSKQNQYELNREFAPVVLEQVVKTGRAFWQEIEAGNELQWHGTQKITLAWKSHGSNYVLNYQTLEPVHLFLNYGNTLFFYNKQQHAMGKLQHEYLEGSKILQLLKAPPIPRAEAERVSLKLLQIWPDLRIPLPVKPDIRDMHIRNTVPTGHMVLASLRVNEQDHANLSSPTHILDVFFRYQNELIQPDTHYEPYTHFNGKKRLYIERDFMAEQALLTQLAQLNFIPLNDGGKFKDNLRLYLPAQSSIKVAWEWFDFQEQQLPKLLEQGWTVFYDDSFQLNYQQADSWYADIDEEKDSGNDWFSITLGIEAEGEKINLLPALVELLATRSTPQELRDYLSANQQVIIPIDSERWVKLPSERIINIVDTLIELYDKEPLDAQGKLLFSKHQSLYLSELLNDPALTWKGAEELKVLNRKIRQFEGIQPIELPDNIDVSLRQYQQEGINWLQFLREYQFSGILADDMGLGKTVQALVNLAYEKQQAQPTTPSLIIAPTSLMGNWKREAARFTPDLKILLLHGLKRKPLFDQMQDYDVILTTYQLVLRDKELHQKQQYHYVILDESQNIKNARAKTAHAIFALKANHRLCLTGTPMENHLGELWSMYHFLMPGYLGTLERFTRLFKTPIEKYGDSQRQKILNQRIQPFMLRRTKTEVATELPPKTEIIRTIPLHGKQRDLYETVRLAMDQKVQQEIGKKGLARSHIIVLDALLKLRQICCDPRLLKLDAAAQINESAKLDMLMEMLPELLEEGRKILLFSQFVKMLKLIEEELYGLGISYTKLTGQTRKRDEAIEKFQNGEVDVFLISLKAGGVGLNLTAADTVIHYDPWWNPATEQQATDRAHRIGQDKPVFVYKLLTEATVEEKILTLQQKKQSLLQALYADKKQTNLFSREELVSLLKPLD